MVSEPFHPRQEVVASDWVGISDPRKIPSRWRSVTADRPSSVSGYGGAPAYRPSSLSGYGGAPVVRPSSLSEQDYPRQQMVWSDWCGWYVPSKPPKFLPALAADRPYSSSASARRPWPSRSIASSSSSLSGYGGGPYQQEMGVIGLGSSACKIPSRFQSESALEPHLPRQIPDSSDLRRRRGPAELALAVSGPDRREVKVPHSTPGKIPNPSFDLGKMKEWVVSYEEDATDPTAVWRILHLRPSEEPRKVPDQIQPRKMELEMARRVEYPRQSNLNSTQGKQWMGAPEGNFNPPPTGHSAVLSGWGQNQLPPACLVSPNLNHLNPSHGPELAKQCSQYPRELPNQFQFQDQSKQWDPNPSNKRVLSVSTVDDDLSYSNNMKIEQMEQTKVEAKLCSVEYQPRRVPGKEILEQEAEEKKGVNESGDEDKVNKDIAVKTNFVMANVPDEAKFYLTQWYMWKRADKRLRGTGLFWKTPPWPDFCIEELTAVYKSELMKMRHEVEEERMMLQMARVWRVERVQRKLVVAKLTVDSKYAPLNKLQSDLEEFLSFHRGNSVDEEIHKSAEEGGDSRIAKKCLGMLKAMRSHHEYNYVAYRKGIGVVCNKKGGFGVDDRWLWSTGLLWNLPPWPDLSLCEADWRGIEKGAAAMCLRMAAMFGGIVGQEVVQACSRKFHPVYQFSYFGSFESLSVEPLESGDLKPENTIYAVQISTSGSKLQKKLEQAKVFMGGSGALGCEFLKNLALMGIATARMYIDSRCGRCVYFQKPLPEPGFLGAKCNTPMIIPHLTENHGASSDPPEKQAPMCTVHSFPHNIDHCLTWARSEFEGLLEKTPTEVNAFLSNPTGYAVASRTARDQLECVIECLHGEKCETFQDCITWTQLKFEDYLFSRVKQLMFTFPEDSMTNSGTPSWFAPKRPPRPLEFTPTELSQLNLVLTASILRAETFIIPIPYWAFTLSSFTEMFVSKLGVDDIYATAIRNCALESPHMLYVSKMIPASDKSRFFAFGRVFSGKVATGLKVHILDRNYIPGQKKGLYVKSVQCTAIWMEKKQESVEDAPYVNTVAMVGLDQFITKKETPINEKEVDACLIRAMKFTVFPVVYIAVLVLSYSVIMLNIDQHNVRVEKKMTEEDSIRNNRHINDGNDLPREFLSELYYSICRNEIRIIWDQQLLLYQWFLIMLSMKRFLRDVLMAFCQWQSWLHSIILRMYCVILWWHYVASMVMQLKIRIYRLFEAEGGVTLSISVLMVEHIMNFTPQPSNPNSNT